MSLHPEPPSYFHSQPIPLGCPSAPALSALLHALNLDWSFISHIVIYMFQCYSRKSSHPHPLPQSPKVCSLHLCLFCCLAYRVIVTTFLNSIQFGLVAQSCPTLCDPMNHSTPGLLVHHQLPELLKLMSIELLMPSSHLILCHPLLLLPSIFPSIRVFSDESVLPITWQKYWSFSFSISPSNEYSGLISFRMDWLDFLSVQGTLESPKHRFHHFYSEILFLRDTVPIIVFLYTAHTYPSCLIHILSHCQVHT